MHAVIARDVREVHMVSEPGGIPAIQEAEADSSSPDAPHVHEAWFARAGPSRRRARTGLQHSASCVNELYRVWNLNVDVVHAQAMTVTPSRDAPTCVSNGIRCA